VRRSKYRCGDQGSETDLAWVAQLVERVLGKDEVTGSIPVPGSRISRRRGVRFENGSVLQELGGGNSTVESHSSKVMVAGSNPVPRSKVYVVAAGAG
jgi:hypothetical protein